MSCFLARGASSKLRFKRGVRLGYSGYLPAASFIKNMNGLLVSFEKRPETCDVREQYALSKMAICSVFGP